LTLLLLLRLVAYVLMPSPHQLPVLSRSLFFNLYLLTLSTLPSFLRIKLHKGKCLCFVHCCIPELIALTWPRVSTQ
jgi:hypothetical protein